MRNLLVIDSDNLAYRNYFTHLNLHTASGLGSGLVHGFMRSIYKFIRSDKYDEIVFVWDTGEESFRHKLYPLYKKNRKKREGFNYNSFGMQREHLIKLLSFIGFKQYKGFGYEADDVIAALAVKASKEIEFLGLSSGPYNVIICSGDHDFFQLLDTNIKMLKHTKEGYVLYGENNLKKDIGVTPAMCVLYYSLVGDTSDNIKGIEGIGPKRAQAVMKDVTRLADLFDPGLNPKYFHKFSEAKDVILRNLELMDLKRKISDVISKTNAIDLGGVSEINAINTLSKFECVDILEKLGEFIGCGK